MNVEPPKKVHVLVGVIFDSAGRVLLAQRPRGKDLAGFWEYPGGKIEPGETRYGALARELREELDIDIGPARPLTRMTHSYPHKTVLLDFWIVRGFTGEPRGLDGQALKWCTSEDLKVVPLLPADRPVIQLAGLPDELRMESGTNYQIMRSAGVPNSGKLAGVRCEDLASAVAAGNGSKRADFIVMSAALSSDQAARLCSHEVSVPVYLKDVPLSVAWDLGATGVSHLAI